MNDGRISAAEAAERCALAARTMNDGRVPAEQAARNLAKIGRELGKCGVWWGEPPDPSRPVSPLGKHASGKTAENCQKTAKKLRRAKHRKRRNAEVRAHVGAIMSRLFPKNR